VNENLPTTINVSLLRSGKIMQIFYHIDNFKHELVSIKSSANKGVPGAGGNINEVDNKKEYEETENYNTNYAPEDFDEDMFAQIKQKIRNHETMHMLVDATAKHSYENKEI
jgi:hypothetical protein